MKLPLIAMACVVFGATAPALSGPLDSFDPETGPYNHSIQYGEATIAAVMRELFAMEGAASGLDYVTFARQYLSAPAGGQTAFEQHSMSPVGQSQTWKHHDGATILLRRPTFELGARDTAVVDDNPFVTPGGSQDEPSLTDIFDRNSPTDGNTRPNTNKPNGQDVVMIPLPAPLAMGMLGLVAVLWNRRRSTV